MGSWDQIQSDSNLNLGKKVHYDQIRKHRDLIFNLQIMRANNEKPQIRQLQSRSDYLIKTLAKAQLAEKNKPKGRTRTRTRNGRKPHLPESSIRVSGQAQAGPSSILTSGHPDVTEEAKDSPKTSSCD